MSEPDYLQLFFKVYPKPTGIGACRQAWTSQIFFHGANPEQMYNAARSYAHKHRDAEKQYLPNPARWLNDQTYLDPDLQELPKEETPLDGWQAKLVDLIGLQRFRINCENSQLEGGVLYLDKPDPVIAIFKNRFQTEMRLCGITDVKKVGVSGEIPRLQNT